MAKPIQRLEPAEKGKTKDRKPASRSQAWKTWERTTCRAMLEHDGPNEMFTKMRLTTSTGRLGHLVELQLDGASKSYAVECKRYATGLGMLKKWWGQVQQLADTYHLSPLLALAFPDAEFTFEGKTKKLPPMHCITQDRHEYLLDCARRCEELDANG